MPSSDLQRAVRIVPDFPKPGIQFKDITPLLADPTLLREAVRRLAAPFEDQRVTKVVGIESRGFILGGLLAGHLGAGFIPVRKEGALPAATSRETYELEYGTDTIEMHTDAVEGHDRVLIHDDVIATGGTAAAAARLLRRTEAEVVGFAFLIEIAALQGRRQLGENVPAHIVLSL